MKEKILKILYQNQNDFVSGELIANMLKISRMAVKKHIDSLIEKGYNIYAVKKNGYRLEQLDDIFDETSLKMFFDLNNINIDINFFESIDSTNVQAKNYFHKSKEGIVIASVQTEGKGRRGRGFISEKGGVYITYYCRPLNITPFDAIKAVICTAVAINKTFHNLGINSSIKWTNDIMYNQKKLCGILCEMLTESEKVEYLMQGTGINVNNDFPQELNNIAISLKQITGKIFNRAKLSADYTMELKNCNEMLFNGQFKEILQYYKQHCCTLKKDVTVSSNNESYTAKAIDIDENGFLQVNVNGEIKTILYGDVSVKAEKNENTEYVNAWY